MQSSHFTATPILALYFQHHVVSFSKPVFPPPIPYLKILGKEERGIVDFELKKFVRTHQIHLPGETKNSWNPKL